MDAWPTEGPTQRLRWLRRNWARALDGAPKLTLSGNVDLRRPRLLAALDALVIALYVEIDDFLDPAVVPAAAGWLVVDQELVSQVACEDEGHPFGRVGCIGDGERAVDEHPKSGPPRHHPSHRPRAVAICAIPSVYSHFLAAASLRLFFFLHFFLVVPPGAVTLTFVKST